MPQRRDRVWRLALYERALTDAEARAFAQHVLRPKLEELTLDGPVTLDAVDVYGNPALGAPGLHAILGEVAASAASTAGRVQPEQTWH